MKCMICENGNVGNRHRAGPTGQKDFMILVDECYKCHCLYPVNPDDLSYLERDWITRWNRNKIAAIYDGVLE